MKRLLVVGAAKASLGASVVYEAEHGTAEWSVETAGISGDENASVDARNAREVARFFLERSSYDAVVCTVGISRPAGIVGDESDLADLVSRLDLSFDVNTLAPLRLLAGYMQRMKQYGSTHGQFVAISSNSAHIARRRSIPYCASKAALSMAIRCTARELAETERWRNLLVYGYEPGLIMGTPMTEGTAAAFEGPLTRIPGAPAGLERTFLARTIMGNLNNPHRGLNGVMMRLDGGEQ